MIQECIICRKIEPEKEFVQVKLSDSKGNIVPGRDHQRAHVECLSKLKPVGNFFDGTH